MVLPDYPADIVPHDSKGEYAHGSACDRRCFAVFRCRGRRCQRQGLLCIPHAGKQGRPTVDLPTSLNGNGQYSGFRQSPSGSISFSSCPTSLVRHHIR